MKTFLNKHNIFNIRFFLRKAINVLCLSFVLSSSSLMAITLPPPIKLPQKGLGQAFCEGLSKGLSEGMRQQAIINQQKALLQQQLDFQKAELQRKTQIFQRYSNKITIILKNYKKDFHVDYMNQLRNSNLPIELSESLVQCCNDYRENRDQLDVFIFQKYTNIVNKLKPPKSSFFIKICNTCYDFLFQLTGKKTKKEIKIADNSKNLMNILDLYNPEHHFRSLKKIETLEISESFKKELIEILNSYRFQRSKIDLELSKNERDLLIYYADQA